MKKRDWIKAITWELLSLLITWIVAVLYFNTLEVTKFAIILTMIKIPFYVLHINLLREFK